jgi:tetratricopeptide (TPR) repeat protein
MSSPPKVFISATSGDLCSVRELVKNALLTIGCLPVEQTSFPPDYRTVRDMLRERIKECQALVHIVGLRYGAEPDRSLFSQGTPRRSYTQMEYDIGRELQKSLGNKRFRMYTFICPEDFPYDLEPDVEDTEKRRLQQQHRQSILQGEVLFEKPGDKMALQARIHALQEETLSLLAAQQRRMWGITAAVLAIFILLGVGLYEWLPNVVNTSVLHSLSPEAVAAHLRVDIEADFQRNREDLLRKGQNWQAIRELEQRRGMRLAQVDNLMAVIRTGLANNPGPIFIEAVRISEQEGVEAALAYLHSHQTNIRVDIDNAAAQAQAADEKLRQALQPWLLEAELHSTRLHWDAALTLLRQVADKAPQWHKAHLRLGELLYTMARYPEAETEFKAALALTHNDIEKAIALNNFAQLLQATNRFAEAEPLMRQALAIDEKSYGPDHPSVARDLNNLAQLLQDTNRLTEAEPLMRRALAIDEKSYGPDHSSVARDLNNLSVLLLAINRFAEAEPLMRRALAIDEKSYGPDHPSVARDLNNLSALLQAINQFAEAEPLMRQALVILLKFTHTADHNHPELKKVFNNYRMLLTAMKLNADDVTVRLGLLAAETGYSSTDWQVLQAQLNGNEKVQ